METEYTCETLLIFNKCDEVYWLMIVPLDNTKEITYFNLYEPHIGGVFTRDYYQDWRKDIPDHIEILSVDKG